MSEVAEVIPAVTVDGVEVFIEPNGDATIVVYGIKRFTVEHTPDGVACSLWHGDAPVSWVTTYDEVSDAA